VPIEKSVVLSPAEVTARRIGFSPMISVLLPLLSGSYEVTPQTDADIALIPNRPCMAPYMALASAQHR
jgi:hypothetical protein